MTPDLARDVSYLLIPGKPDNDYAHMPLHNQAYTFWKEFWTSVLKANGTDKQVNCDEFMRQNWITVLMHQDQIIGMHTYTFFNLDQFAAREHSYFARLFTEDFLRQLDAQGARSIMTMEYFSVASAWRASKVGVSLAAVLACLGLRIATDAGVDVTISAARSDVGAVKLGHDLGAVSLVKDVPLYNTPCDLIAFFPENIRQPADPQVSNLADIYWNQRIDTSIDAFGRKLRIVA